MGLKKVAKKVAKKSVDTVKKTSEVTDTAAKTMMGDGGKSLFFLIISMVCLWLIMDMFYGDKKISQLVDSIFEGGEN